MANRLETAFTRVAGVFFGDGIQPTPELSNNGAKELIKASSQEELNNSSVEHQQRAFLDKQYRTIVKSDYQKKMMYDHNRKAQWADYVAMDYYPTIGAALNLFAEESTALGADGKNLKVYSNNKRVRQVLENLFYNTLDLQSTLPMWARGLCQYGDAFAFLRLDPKNGIIGAKMLNWIDVERVEETLEIDGQDKGVNVYFKHTNLSGTEQQYQIWQMAHFRLLGDGRRLPYGTSILDKVRRTYKMLMLMEDSMMVYRILRAAERRVHKVLVGNAEGEAAAEIVQKAASETRGSKFVDPSTGDFDWKYNVASIDQDIFVGVRDQNAQNPIETLPGASNLDAISDISYLRDNLFVGLECPKGFLSFSEDGGGGEGKALSMLDIRFARKVNRVQQALISELNKLAVIHLSLLGGDYLEHLDNFQLTLANPSRQSEILANEVMKAKLDTYVTATTPNEGGIKPMSNSKAAKEILGISEEDWYDDLLTQFVESKIGDEIKNGGQLAKTSRLFDKYIKFTNAGISLDPNKPADGADGAPADPMAPVDTAAAGGGVDPLAMAGGGDISNSPGGAADPLGGMPALKEGASGKRVARHAYWPSEEEAVDNSEQELSNELEEGNPLFYQGEVLRSRLTEAIKKG